MRLLFVLALESVVKIVAKKKESVVKMGVHVAEEWCRRLCSQKLIHNLYVVNLNLEAVWFHVFSMSSIHGVNILHYFMFGWIE